MIYSSAAKIMKILPEIFTSPEWQQTLREALVLPDSAYSKANGWLRSERAALVSQPDTTDLARRGSQQTGIAAEEFGKLVKIVMNHGFYVVDDKAFEGVSEDLKGLGFDDDQLNRFSDLMKGLRFPEGPLTIKASWLAQSVVPTLTDVRAVCDLRAVFSQPAAPEAEDESSELQALVPVVLLSLDIKDESGAAKSVAVQLTEGDLGTVRRVLDQAAAQMKIISNLGRKALPSQS
jgi:hypothetical protein